MAKYTVRITNEEGNILAWIDQDGSKCIMQPGFPGESEGWKTEDEALAWANKQAAELEAAHESVLAEAARKKELEDAQLAAAKAQIDTAEALKVQNSALIALLEKLNNSN